MVATAHALLLIHIEVLRILFEYNLSPPPSPPLPTNHSGKYTVDVPVGYYTQVLGLGAAPNDVTFATGKGVYCEEQDYSIGGALSTFWRGQCLVQ